MSNEVKAKSWPKHFQFAYTTTGAPAVLVYAEVDTAQEIEKGMALVLSSDEKVSEADANSDELYGIAAAAGDAGDVIPIYAGCKENVFVGQNDLKTDDVYPGDVCDIKVDSDVHYVDTGGNTEDVLIILGRVPGDDDEDTDDPGRLYFQIYRSEYDKIMGAK